MECTAKRGVGSTSGRANEAGHDLQSVLEQKAHLAEQVAAAF